MAIPNRFYEGVSGWSASVMGTIADSQQIYPITDKVRQVDQHNKYTAGAGSALYTARSFPKEFWNRISFISEPTGHLTGFYELTGIGARDRADILMEILDPNRSVEANYRLWNVTTKDGETLSGRLDAETQTAVEILDLSGTKHSVQRKDIASLESSPLSIMPTGFEQIPESDLAGLLEYLAHSNHPPGK